MTQSYIITGTTTGIGKTVASALLVAALKARYWKPVQSGLEEETDSEYVRRVTGCPAEDILPEQYRLQFPASPHLSAEREGVEIRPETVRLPEPDHRPLIVEGAGGLLVPWTRSYFQADWFRSAGLPVIVVASTVLGTINHTLLTLEGLRSRGIPVHSVILNGPEHPDNRRVITESGQVLISGWIPPVTGPVTREVLISIFSDHFKSELFR